MSHDEPFFIVGCDRSGTTLLRLILNAHPRLCVPNESDFIPILHDVAVREFGSTDPIPDVERLLEALFATKRYRLWGLDDAEVARRVRASGRSVTAVVDAVFRCFTEREGKARWGDKTPRYTLRLATIARLFPAARALLLVRDPRDVQASLADVAWHPGSPIFNARKWRDYWLQASSDLERHFPGRHLVVRYEALVSEPDATVRQVAAFLEEDFVPEMLCFYEDAEQHQPEGTQDHALTLGPVTTASVGRWQRDISRLDAFVVEALAGDVMASLGYAPAVSPSWFRQMLTSPWRGDGGRCRGGR
jgi:hypothetical protein